MEADSDIDLASVDSDIDVGVRVASEDADAEQTAEGRRKRRRFPSTCPEICAAAGIFMWMVVDPSLRDLACHIALASGRDKEDQVCCVGLAAVAWHLATPADSNIESEETLAMRKAATRGRRCRCLGYLEYHAVLMHVMGEPHEILASALTDPMLARTLRLQLEGAACGEQTVAQLLEGEDPPKHVALISKAHAAALCAKGGGCVRSIPLSGRSRLVNVFDNFPTTDHIRQFTRFLETETQHAAADPENEDSEFDNDVEYARKGNPKFPEIEAETYF